MSAWPVTVQEALAADPSWGPWHRFDTGPSWWRIGARPEGLGEVLQAFDRPGPWAAWWAALHEQARRWVREQGLDDVLDVCAPLHAGADHVVWRRAVGNALRDFTREEDRVPDPPSALPALLDRLPRETDDPAGALLVRRIEAEDPNVVYVWPEAAFRVQSLEPSFAELEAFG